MEIENKNPIEVSGINVDAVREYMFSEYPDLPEIIEELKNNPNRVNLDEIL